MARIPGSVAAREGMQLALEQAAIAREEGEIPVGAVVMRGGDVIAAAHNETVALGHPTAHAEFLAIHRALRAVLLADSLRSPLIASGFRQVKQFSCLRTATEVLGVYNEVARAKVVPTVATPPPVRGR